MLSKYIHKYISNMHCFTFTGLLQMCFDSSEGTVQLHSETTLPHRSRPFNISMAVHSTH